jgi:hypothetical protein
MRNSVNVKRVLSLNQHLNILSDVGQKGLHDFRKFDNIKEVPNLFKLTSSYTGSVVESKPFAERVLSMKNKGSERQK